MGKPTGKKKAQPQSKGKSGGANAKQNKSGDQGTKAYDKDTAVFITMSQGLKEEGNKLFQQRDYEGAMLKYEKALKLLPRNHIDVAHLHSNMAASYMHMGVADYPKAIRECNLALEVAPKYSKALLKRARCYETINRLELALRDVNTVLSTEPKNLTALELEEGLKKAIENKGIQVGDKGIILAPENIEYLPDSPPCIVKEKNKKKSHKNEKKKAEDKAEEKKIEGKIDEKKAEDKTEEKKIEGKIDEKKAEDRAEENKIEGKMDEKKAEDKVVVEENVGSIKKEEATRTVKFVFGEDIRWAQLPVKCSIVQLRETVRNRFPSSKAVLIKYRDQEGDLVTITTTEELGWAEASAYSQGSLRLYIVEVHPEQEPIFEAIENGKDEEKSWKNQNKIAEIDENGNGEMETRPTCIDDWIIQFACLFKNHVGFNSDAYLNLHELGMKLYSEAMEDTVTSEEAQGLFDIAAEKFQEMAALALFNWGNVHMSRARKRVFFTEDASSESILEQVKTAYEWAQREYVKAGNRYEEALKIKPDFYEGLLALGQQKFEQAKLSWYYAIGHKVDLETWPSSEVIELFDGAEDNMERGMQMWEEMEEQGPIELLKPDKAKTQLKKMGLDGLFKDVSAEEAAEQAANMRSQINLLWGTMLYERSIVEFKLGMPVWEECLEVAVEKFELAGASPTDIAVMIKNHCSNETAPEGVGFKIDEIVQAWNEMYDAKRWQSGVPSFRLEPLFRRRIPKLHHLLENV
ncbi:protein PHOX1-like isoform X2 [Macadamia integrifolia]|uniref:protein PHOX1-like isoform X2 n=1 Tax=Macadamia integrifolia TaxID=60698 RepID=UPI001C4E6294|nr:protein PHOX1-like isoform X2 [Macadamia integrifolia]